MSKTIDHPLDLLTMVGEPLGSTNRITMEQSRIDLFADATEDHQWIHVNSGKAKDGPFGATIAHGFLTLSLANKFLPSLLIMNQVTMGVNYGCDKVRFPNTVKVGQRIRGRGEVIKAEQKPNGVQVVVRITIEVEESPACVVDTISRFYYSGLMRWIMNFARTNAPLCLHDVGKGR